MIAFILCLCPEPTGQVVADHRLLCDSEVKLIVHDFLTWPGPLPSEIYNSLSSSGGWTCFYMRLRHWAIWVDKTAWFNVDVAAVLLLTVALHWTVFALRCWYKMWCKGPIRRVSLSTVPTLSLNFSEFLSLKRFRPTHFLDLSLTRLLFITLSSTQDDKHECFRLQLNVLQWYVVKLHVTVIFFSYVFVEPRMSFNHAEIQKTTNFSHPSLTLTV